MHGSLPIGRNAAIKPSDRVVGKSQEQLLPRKFPTELSEEKLDDWFVIAAQSLLAPKPGFILDLETGCGERNGDRYASGTVKPPGNLIRTLLRSRHGRPWLNAIMDGCEEEWWRELQRAERLAHAINSVE